MSKAAIGEAMDILRDLPDTDQETVLQFLKELKARQNMDSTSEGSHPIPALRNINGLLVYTGDVLGDPALFLKISREEREQEILERASRNADQ